GSAPTWAVQNLPIVSLGTDPNPFTVYTAFDLGPLGIAPGVDLSTLDGYKTVTADPLTAMPAAGMPYDPDTPVGSFNYDAEGKDNGAGTGPHNDPGTPVPNGSIAFVV